MENIFFIGLIMLFSFMLLWVLILFLIIYALPIIIAYVRKHNHILEISILTLALGWSFLGWLAAILWALNSDTIEECNQDTGGV